VTTQGTDTITYRITERYYHDGRTTVTVAKVDDGSSPRSVAQARTSEYDEYQTDRPTRAEAESYAEDVWNDLLFPD